MNVQDLLAVLNSASPSLRARLAAWADDEELKVLRLGCNADVFAHGRAVGAAQVYRTIADAARPKGITDAPAPDSTEPLVFNVTDLS